MQLIPLPVRQNEEEIQRNILKWEIDHFNKQELPQGVHNIQLTNSDLSSRQFVFQKITDKETFLPRDETFTEVKSWKAGDIIIYYKKGFFKKPKPLLAGVLISKHQVKSKWGIKGPIVEHDIGTIPRITFGDYFCVFRRQ